MNWGFDGCNGCSLYSSSSINFAILLNFFLLLYCIRNSNDKLCPQISMGFSQATQVSTFLGHFQVVPSLFLKASCSPYPTPSLFFPTHFSSQRHLILNAWNRLQGENKSEVIDLKKTKQESLKGDLNWAANFPGGGGGCALRPQGLLLPIA